MLKTIFISADHGTAIVYFLQSEVVPRLLEAGIEVVVLTDDEGAERRTERARAPLLERSRRWRAVRCA